MGRGQLKPYLVFPGSETTYHCNRCNRDLPELAFRSMFHVESLPREMVRRHVNVLHPICKSCLDQVHGEHTKHPLYRPSIDRFFSRLISSVRGAGRTRGIAVLVEKDDLLGLFLEQEGKCAMSGATMVLEEGTNQVRNRMRPSVDRIDSAGNYTADNIQLICNVLNIMKGTMSQVDFLRWCHRVSEYRASREDELLRHVS